MRKSSVSVILALAAIFLVAIPAAGKEVPGLFVNEAMERSQVISSEDAIIRAIFDKYAACVGCYDADGWMALWDEEGVQLPPNCLMRVGKSAILAANYDAIKNQSYLKTMNIQTEEVILFSSEGYALARGVYNSTRTPRAGGQPIYIDGKFMTIFHRQPDGSWLIYRDIFNSNL